MRKSLERRKTAKKSARQPEPSTARIVGLPSATSSLTSICRSPSLQIVAGEVKEVVGEARIVEVGSGTVDEVLARFGDELFLTRSELEEYAGSRRGNKMLTLVLEDVKKCAVPLGLDKSITMAGQYMTKTMLKSLRANAY